MELPVMSPARKEPDTSTYSGRVSQRIRELREKKGLTVKELIERMAEAGYEMTTGAFSHWETGRGQPNLDAIPAIATALGVRKSQLFPE